MDGGPPRGPRVNVPNLGLYYTGDNVDNTLPRIPPAKPKPNLDPYATPPASTTTSGNRYRPNQKPVNNDEISRMMKQETPSPKRYSSRPSQVYDSNKASSQEAKIEESKNFELTPWFLRPLASPSTERALGRQARIVKIGLRSSDGRRTDIHIIFLLYQMMIGALGGLVAGIESGYLALPADPGVNSSVVQGGMASSKLVWRSCKRALAAGLLFNFVEKNIEQSRGKSDWKNFAYAGVVCGGLYGSRGGLRGSLTASTMFGAFAGLSGFYEQLKRKSKMK